MNTIVCNTRTGAVSEYTGFSFQSVTPTHAGDAAGLFALGGDTDNGQPIVSTIRLPKTLREDTRRTFVEMVYVSIQGAGAARLTVHAPAQDWSYYFALRANGQTRCQVGRGIRENYLGLSISTPQGQPFALDRVEVLEHKSQARRV